MSRPSPRLPVSASPRPPSPRLPVRIHPSAFIPELLSGFRRPGRLSLVHEFNDGDERVGVGRVVDADDGGRGVFAFDLDAALKARGLDGLLLQLRELRVLRLEDV